MGVDELYSCVACASLSGVKERLPGTPPARRGRAAHSALGALSTRGALAAASLQPPISLPFRRMHCCIRIFDPTFDPCGWCC